MSAKLIIWIPGTPNIHGYIRRDFKWSPPHKCYLYLGRELEIEEFNRVVDKAIRENERWHPSVKAIAAVPQEAPASISTLSVAREITVEEAEEVMLRLAPGRLKKMPGRKPAQQAVG